MGVYRKSIEAGTFEHRFYEALGFPPVSGREGRSFVLRITLGDMELLDGFYMSLPGDASDVCIEDVIRKYVLCEREEDRIRVKRKLARDPNPDLLDIYDSLLWLYEQFETGRITLSYHINNGASDIPPTDPVSQHQQICKADGAQRSRAAECRRSRVAGHEGSYSLLDLVLEVYDNVDPFSGLTDEQKNAMLMDFRGIFIMYLMDKFGYQPSGSRAAECRRSDHVGESPDCEQLSTVLEYLVSEDVGLLRMCGETSPPSASPQALESPRTRGSDQNARSARTRGEYSITPGGYEFLNNIIDEAEFYIDNYDIFGDVYMKEASDIRFNTGYGDNLIVPVFIREGIDPYRALFIVALYLGNMDHLASDLAALFSEDPFRELFGLIAHSPTMKDIGIELLDHIIREGSLKVEERQLREARLEHIKSIEQRMNSNK